MTNDAFVEKYARVMSTEQKSYYGIKDKNSDSSIQDKLEYKYKKQCEFEDFMLNNFNIK